MRNRKQFHIVLFVFIIIVIALITFFVAKKSSNDNHLHQNQKTIQTSLKEKGIFATETQEETFKKLVKSDYELFRENMQKIILGDNNETSNRKVFSGALEGMYTIHESIIMYDEKGNMWAATIESNVNTRKIKYFTTVAADKNKLPAEIEKWRERLSDYPITYVQ